MRVGISLTTNYPDVKDPRQGARWIIERAAAARRAALDSLFIGDQHASPTPYYQNTPMLARLLAEWGEAPAGCLFLLPLWHPVLVAEQIGTLAAIARGPFIMQCGLGWGDDRFLAMGMNIKTRPSVFEEALDIVRRLLAGETVSASRRFRIAGASLALRPPSRSKSISARAHCRRLIALGGWRTAGLRAPALPARRPARRPISIGSAAPFTAESPARSCCGATFTSANRRMRRRRYCSRR